MIKKVFSLVILAYYCCIAVRAAEPQVNIQGTIFEVDSLAYMKVGPGAMYTALNLKAGTKELKVYFLAIDKNNPYVRFNSLVGRDSTVMGECISSAAKRHSKPGEIYFAGTNGDFYETTGSYVGRTINGSLIGGEIVRTPHSSRPMVVVDKLNELYIDQMTFSGTVTKQSESFLISDVNDQRGADELILFNSYNGYYTHSNDYGTEVLIELLPEYKWGVNKSLKAKVIQIVNDKGNMRLDKGQAILSGNGIAAEFLKNIKVAEILTLELNYKLNNSASQPDIYGGVGGDRFILKDGTVTDNDWAENHPRTALGYNQRQNIFCIVDGRSAYSAGVTTKQLGDIIKSAGATDAINLDGGGSSGMYIRQYGMMNRCSDGSERAVANGFFAVCTAPEDEKIAEILPKQRNYKLPPYGVISPVILGYNQYGLLIDSNVKASLSCDTELGYINENGQFVASGKKGGTLHVSFGNIKTTIQIQKVESAPIRLLLDSVIVDNSKSYEIEVIGTVGEDLLKVSPAALQWEVEYPELCTVSEGVVTGIVNGRTHLYGTLGEYKDTILIKVEIPESRKSNAFDFSDNWDITASTALKEFNTRIDEENALRLEYVFSNGRFSNILLKNFSSVFGLPDTLNLIVDPAGASFSKMILALKANNETLSKSFTIENPSTSQPSVFTIPVSELTIDKENRNMYPITLDYIQFYLAATGNVSGQKYTPALKEFSAIYKNISLGLNPKWLISGVKVYPNPVINDWLTLEMPIEQGEEFEISIVGSDGSIWLTRKILAGKNSINLSALPSGLYLLNVSNANINQTAKILLK